MSPFDMLIFFFFILVTIKAAASCIDYWRDIDDELAEASTPHRTPVRATLSRTVRTGRPSSVRVTPIKRVNTPAKVYARTYNDNRQIILKDKNPFFLRKGTYPALLYITVLPYHTSQKQGRDISRPIPYDLDRFGIRTILCSFLPSWTY